jgi:hypothetical protein
MANENTILLSIYLLGPNDILHTTSKDDNVPQRATLYTRLSSACTVINQHLTSQAGLWNCGGDGLIFGVHCNDNQTELEQAHDTDDWQNHLYEQTQDVQLHGRSSSSINQPHLRASLPYANSINDAWRAIHLSFSISRLLFSHDLPCATEVLDTDGQLLLIEAAEHLPSWVDDDVINGGVGGPPGCVNRCWIVNGLVRLIPPDNKEYCMDSPLLGRREALLLLRECLDEENFVVDEVQDAIERRVGMVDYSFAQKRSKRKESESNDKSSTSMHYHVAAVVVPASIAYFIQRNANLVPFLVDSFCTAAPNYLERRSDKTKGDHESIHHAVIEEAEEGTTHTNHDDKTTSARNSTKSKDTKSSTLGAHFPYEQIVMLPLTMTRTTYAELITGRGVIPSFPIPNEYRSVEINRFQRQLVQMGSMDRRNVWSRAVEVGVRLCAGLDWLLDGDSSTNEVQSIGDIERRLRIYWSRIDAEANITPHDKNSINTDTIYSNSWIEQAWNAGPNNTTGNNQILIDALQSMSKCPVFNPELSKNLCDEPCPYSRPGVSLYNMVHAGLLQGLKWARGEFDNTTFRFPREWEVDDDLWMEVNSLEELENEMQKLSSTNDNRPLNGKPARRTTRRSGRNRIQHAACMKSDKEDETTSIAQDKTDQDVKALDKMLHGFKSLVEGEGDMGGVVTQQKQTYILTEICAPEQAMAQRVTIDPRIFLNILQDKLHTSHMTTGTHGPANDGLDVSKFFYKEDLDEDASDSSVDSKCEENFGSHLDQGPQPLRGLMVSIVALIPLCVITLSQVADIFFLYICRNRWMKSCKLAGQQILPFKTSLLKPTTMPIMLLCYQIC